MIKLKLSSIKIERDIYIYIVDICVTILFICIHIYIYMRKCMMLAGGRVKAMGKLSGPYYRKATIYGG